MVLTLKPTQVTERQIDDFLNKQHSETRTLNFSRNQGFTQLPIRLLIEVKIRNTNHVVKKAYKQAGTVVAATHARISMFPKPPLEIPTIPLIKTGTYAMHMRKTHRL
jgi:hypothetical protein